MSFEQLAQMNNMDVIGNQLNIPTMRWLEQLSETSRQMSLKSSKPFQLRGEVLTPTPALIELDRVFKMTNDLISNGYALQLDTLPNELVTSKDALFLFVKTKQIMQQYGWFDILNINQDPNKEPINSILKQLWNEVRGYSASSEAENDVKKRKELNSSQTRENSRIVSQLLTQHTNLNLTRLSFFFTSTGNIEHLQLKELEKQAIQLKSKLINELQQLNQDKLLCIQWRIQRSLHGQYYLNMLVYHDEQHLLQQSQDQNLLSHTFDTESQLTIQLDLSQIFNRTLKIERDNFQGTNLAEWKVIFNNMLYPLRYYYYQSKVISPRFEYIMY
ncbi:hypothetical protein [Acinetobacter sp. NIPH 2699]|uniref:hypothetical protein n=1 Tax=Acinetobacter sp. NIPH 2699 TaxID=2923433 RepID=UPI001F4B3EB8|nr:hypothetical protein [Acinetobacter sp. NIPH 2699]MCH7337160.1 hypothetical protein [Acinetobacter sp. NIPH 2699]